MKISPQSNLMICLLLLLAGGCGGETVSLPPPAHLATAYATDCRFTVDGVAVSDDDLRTEPDAEHEVITTFRLAEPEKYRDGVQCKVRLVGQHSQRGLITHGNFGASVRPDREGRVSLKGRIPIPSRAGEYELQALIQEAKERHLVGRIGVIVAESD